MCHGKTTEAPREFRECDGSFFFREIKNYNSAKLIFVLSLADQGLEIPLTHHRVQAPSQSPEQEH